MSITLEGLPDLPNTATTTVPFPTLLSLLNEAANHKTEKIPQRFAIQTANYHIKPTTTSEDVTCQITLQIQVLVDQWMKIPLFSKQCAIVSSTIKSETDNETSVSIPSSSTSTTTPSTASLADSSSDPYTASLSISSSGHQFIVNRAGKYTIEITAQIQFSNQRKTGLQLAVPKVISDRLKVYYSTMNQSRHIDFVRFSFFGFLFV